ncbi:MAG TPA: HNH endonuclease signature motif containing protein [Methylomirabilota bacterium]|jgi:hypothetical protein|nr:HNH endonuclease signature motif containing protein [Methylomirabilota bacterium]
MGFVSPVTAAEIAREKEKARRLRASPWWKRRLARGRCEYCREAARAGELTMDHRVPLVRGGRSTKGNVVAACKACNTAKKYLLPMEWEEYLARLAEGSDEPAASPPEKHWTREPGRS